MTLFQISRMLNYKVGNFPSVYTIITLSECLTPYNNHFVCLSINFSHGHICMARTDQICCMGTGTSIEFSVSHITSRSLLPAL